MINDLINELTQEKINEKQVLKEFGEGGKFKVYDIYPGAMILIHDMLETDNDIDIDSPDVMRLFFLAFSNMEEVDKELLGKDVFSLLITKPNAIMSEMITEVLKVSNNALEKYIEAIQTYNELPDEQKVELIKFFNKES